MKKTISMFISLSLLCLLVISGCGNKYSDAEKVLSKQADVFEDYIEAMDNVKNADDMVKAIGSFTTEMSDMIPELQKISEKYPEFKNEEEAPVELKEEIDKITALSEKMSGVMMKNMQYMADPKVQKALQEQGRVMSESLDK